MCKVVIAIALVCNADGIAGMAQLMDVQEYNEILLQLIVSISLLLWLCTI